MSKPKGKAVKLKASFGILAVVVVGLWAVVHFVWPEGYDQFRRRGPQYYEHFVDGCEQLMAQYTPPITNSQAAADVAATDDPEERRQLHFFLFKRKILGDDESLPPIIRNLKSNYILFDPDRVFISFGDGRMGWAIICEPNHQDDSIWDLATNGDGFGQVIFSRKRSAK